jgi:hypothetical protein
MDTHPRVSEPAIHFFEARMSIADLHRSLELAAERAGDIYPAIYDAYFARCAGSRDLMQLTDIYMRGRMLESLFELLMADDVADQIAYLRFETRNHSSWGVQPQMYDNLFTAVRDTVRDACGPDWTPTMAGAWDTRIGDLVREIRSAPPTA